MAGPTCAQCRDVDRVVAIRTPRDLDRAIRVIQANLGDGTLRESRYWPEAVLDTRNGVPFAEFAERRPQVDVVEYYFECSTCNRLYHLAVDVYHGAGGQWCPVDDGDEPRE